ncbi:Pycsar system effector family protein [Streptomyces sp. NPDC056347]|uniref:Pycsar system effector family protein n=1 Tax=Streptomyces sp. NPDC056347 TaxID=3345790 RepID=UPI0035D96251
MTDHAPARSVEAGDRLLDGLRAEVARADSKASVLVAALGMTAGVLSGWLAGSTWRPGSLNGTGTALWWTGIGGLAAALVSLLMAVLPRYHRSTWIPGEPLTYFGDIRDAARRGLLPEALDATENSRTAALVTALAETSRIALCKHRWIRAGLLAYSLGAVLLPASLLLG